MPETVTDKTAAPQAQEPAARAQAEPASKQGAPSSTAHGGAYTLVRELTAAGGGPEPPPDKLTHVFRKAEFANPVNDAQKERALGALQRQYGNRYVQRVLSGGAPEPTGADASTIVQRQEAQGASAGEHDTPAPQLEQSGGRPLDAGTRDSMGSRLGQDFGNVRVHDDGEAHRAAKSLNAEAFTTGRDIYFSQGAYNPSSQPGQKLLAHELAHVAQQNQGAAGARPQGFSVSHPSDPLERQADAAGEAVMRGEMFPALTSTTAPVYQRQAAAPAPAAPAPAAPAGGAGSKDYSFEIAGKTVMFKDLLKVAGVGNKLNVPSKYLTTQLPFFKLTGASLDLDDNKMPTGATVSLAVSKPPLEGTGSVTVDKQGQATGTAHVVFSSSKIPGLKQTELDATVTNKDFSFDASIDFELPKVTGNLKYKYADQKHSGKGKANYEGSKLKGGIEIIMSEAGLISGIGMLEMELFKGLKGEVEVGVDEKRNIGVKGRLSVPGQIELFPEKKFEKSFFSFEKKFPIWGIVIPVIDVNVGIFAEIHAGAGFRSKFGPGVLRDIALTGEFGTDPEAATEMGLGGEFFLPAGAEVVANVGGGIGLGLAVADITGGVEAVGVAGLYSALTVRPQFNYSGGKYTISGMAELAGVAQLKFGINAFAKIDVGVWLFKGTVWRKDWTLAEWVWNTGLNIALRANMSYTLGEDFAPDISFETGQVDPEKFIKDVMPESGSPVPAPPKPPVPDKGVLTAEGAQGTQAGGAPGEAPAPPTPGSPPVKTQAGAAPPKTPGAPGAQPPGPAPAGGAPVQAGPDAGQPPQDAAAKSAAVKAKVHDELTRLAGKSLGTPEEVGALLTSLYSQYQPEGLKSLEVIGDESNLGQFEVVAAASATTPVGKFLIANVIKKNPVKDISINLDLLSRETHIFAEMPDGSMKTYKNQVKVHAEMWFLGELPQLIKEHKTTANPKPRFVLNINRSPCNTCMSELGKQAYKYRDDAQLVVNATNVYQYSDAEKRPIVQSSMEKLVEMHYAGVEVGIWDIWEQIDKAQAFEPVLKGLSQEVIDRNLEGKQELERYLNGLKAEIAKRAKITHMKRP